MGGEGDLVNVKEYPISFVHGENVLKLTVGSQLYNCEHTKNHK